ncbi:fluoride efflux transporter CrcB [Massilia sp. 9096]|uniref:fluoride efflux transporter CrcB n=1 Tax=Massilia sp. 9096 TaxID=1500894 RepID=UPI00055BFDEB|nr:fluoride efflux transporter CrcB [Massilia sp. 9096]
MGISSVFAVASGAALGALLRWWISVIMNSLFPAIPPGTLLVNLAGAYVIGMAIPWFTNTSSLPPEIRLFVVTGFLGGLTTMSSFAGEVVTLLRAGRLTMGAVAVLLHVGGSIAMCALGMACTGLLMRR